MLYADVVNAWMALLEEAPSPYTPDTDMATVLPRAIEYATNRICRDMVMLAQRQQVLLATVAGSREVDLSTLNPPVLVVEGFALVGAGTGPVPPVNPNTRRTVNANSTVGDRTIVSTDSVIYADITAGAVVIIAPRSMGSSTSTQIVTVYLIGTPQPGYDVTIEDDTGARIYALVSTGPNVCTVTSDGTTVEAR